MLIVGHRGPAALALAAAALLTTLAGAPGVRGLDGPRSAVVVRAVHGQSGLLDAAVAAAGGTVTRHIGIVDAVAAQVPAGRLAALRAQPGIVEITPDLPVQLTSDPAGYDAAADVNSALSITGATGARAYWRAGYTGSGIDVALIDSGTVPVDGLGGAKVIDGPDLSLESTVPALRHRDTFGHGTHMAGLIAGRDAEVTGPAAADTAGYQGMAPGARILSVKVADNRGIADISQVLAGIDWVVQHAHDPGMNVRVMNLSFGTNANQQYVLDPLAFAAETAWHQGIVVIASTGNAGWKNGINNPADDPFVIAVGAADTHGTATRADDTVAPFSSGGDGVRNPDLVAPGVHLQGLRDPASWLDYNNPQAVLAGRFFRGSGTSQAAAIASGAAALLIQQHPQATPDQIKVLLTGTSTHLAAQPQNLQGAGELNLNGALTAPLLSGPAATQVYTPSTGMGTIEGSRGDVHVQFANGVQVRGELDVHLSPLAAGPLAYLESVLGAWSGHVFNGAIWTDNTAPPNGSQWSGSQWSSAEWS